MAFVPIRTYGDGILIISGDSVRGQDAVGGSGGAGSVLALRGGDGDGVGNAGGVTITGGAPGASANADGGNVTISGTNSAAAGTGDGGDVILAPGLALDSGVDGVVSISNAAELTTGGNITLNSASPTLRMGTGAGAPNFVIDKDGGGQGDIFFESDSLTEWIIRCEATTEDLLIRRFIAGVSQDIALQITHTTGLVTLANNLTLSSASPTALVGDGTGTPSIELNKSDAGTSAVRWRNIGFTRWTAGLDTSEAWALGRFDGAAAFQDNPIVVSNTTGNVTLANNLTLNSAGATLAIGDGTTIGQLLGLSFRKEATSTVDLNFFVGTSESTNSKRIRFDASEALNIGSYNGATWDDALTIDNNADVTVANDLTVGANLTLNSASPTTTFGDGAGSPLTTYNKLDAGFSQISFENGSVNDKRILHNSDETLILQHWNGGSYDNALTVDNNADVIVTNQLLVDGATEANGAINAKSIVFGDGTGAFGISAFIGAASIGRFGVTDVSGGAMRGGFQMNSGGDSIILIAAGTAVTNATSAAFSPFSNGDKSLGLTGSRWDTGFINTVLVGGATVALGVAGNADVIVGAIEAADHGITIVTGTANAGAISFADVAGTMRGQVQYDHNVEAMDLSIAGVSEAILTAGAFGPVSNAGLDLANASERFAIGFINKPHANVTLISDGATVTVGDNHFVNIVAPTAKSTADLPTAVVGDWYEIDLQDETSTADINPAADDSINGASAGVAKNLTVAGLYIIYALDAANWRLFGPLAVT